MTIIERNIYRVEALRRRAEKKRFLRFQSQTSNMRPVVFSFGAGGGEKFSCDCPECAAESAGKPNLMTDAGDGISLMSTAHPKASWWKRPLLWLRCQRGLRASSLETVEIELQDKGNGKPRP
jgi:hypothetical protein